MKNFKLKKLVAVALVAMTIATVAPVGASAAWKQDSNGWWNTEGNSYSKGWRAINGTWYYFGSDGYMKTGWINDGCKWYFTETSGAMKTGVVEVDGKAYYLAPSGEMQTGDVTLNEVTYTFAASGEAIGDKIPTQTITSTSTKTVVTPSKTTETTENSSSNSDKSSSNSNKSSNSDSDSVEKDVKLSQTVIDARYKSDTKITMSVAQNADGTTTIKPTLRFTPGTYTESITTHKKTYSVNKDLYVTFNGKDAYISGNYIDGYKIDAGVTGEVEITASISIYDSTNGKLYYVTAAPETVTIPANYV
ncbi:hypothetical protein B0P06_000918 [Clostridium saccharoperbutylacetonicum]|uniref:Cell wall binding repeat-containing protein n=1 Tax=Clostridium saccharoperbutylacetonicum N1-4(HMT) TaxID=931276 RepID=M1LQ37_9CLOT|nr:cell wall-binding repeat-containing protein [Clostridium saccharoperbutylacetonicum]AGF55000.1 cell wall binding repeat-containing protein [Clostridium saccharoperbutylacetonicum N1-4(HMT)]NRT64291.1 hypothetical protein [Clostridium saccharoperbutylacetonicum]NSB27660.1 hypothetical protein [Clostridium saccharoperbutylacetonicum]NSB41147.1 hypothetical protein [Clostridium saccharoperbutylacetonicum]